MNRFHTLCLFAALIVAGGCKEESASDPNIADRFDPLFAQELESRGYVADAEHITVEEVGRIAELDLYGGSDRGELVSLQGIEYFTSLVELDCSFNRLTSLDLSKNTALEVLLCGFNKLSALDTSHNPALTEFDCRSNLLSELDLSRNAALEVLLCEHNRLASLDLSGHPALRKLSCGVNSLTSLDLSGNPALTALSCFSNELTSLDTSHNPALTEIVCSGNRLTSLNISANTKLVCLECDYNPGDGSVFPVVAWFDNGSVPTGALPSGPGAYDFTTGSWICHDGSTVSIDYRRAE